MFRWRIKTIKFWQKTVVAAGNYLKDFNPHLQLSVPPAPEQSPVQDNFSWAKTHWDSELTYWQVLSASLGFTERGLYRERQDLQVTRVTVFSQQQDLKYSSSRRKNYFQKLSPDDANRLEDLPDLFIWQTAGKDLFEWGSKRAVIRGARNSLFFVAES